ncbi:unnamed protein product [Cylicocyclus nassatus]|uniref:Endothelin-converting enzyme 1 n=1 Tax=Cylicocyclus nassatus TaxID=53992 RepID=A0AA36H9Z6_CYLNA|nr:unnamed protein product [Cylicocyclus nassatus]
MRWAVVLMPLCLCTPDATPPYEDDVKDIGSLADDEGYNIASEILRNSINFSVNPCEDFYEFTCGNWIASHPIPEDKISYDHFQILKAKVQEQLRGLYESNDTFGSKAVNALKTFYKKCMDKDELNRIGAKRLIENVKSFGVWPALEGDDNWKEENYNLTSLLIHVYLRRQVFAFVTFDKSKDDTKIRHILQFDRDELLGGGYYYYLGEEKNGTQIESLKHFLISQIEQIQKDGGMPTNISKIEKDVDEIIDLEMRMAEIMYADVNDTKTVRGFHLSDMQEFMPTINWQQFFRAVAPSASHYFASDPEILINDVDYIKSINKLLQSVDPRIITNYIFLRFSREWLDEMGDVYEDIEQEFNEVAHGQEQKTLRWKVCTNSAMHYMDYATTALYVKKELHETTKEDVLEIAKNLKEEFGKNLNAIDWIDDETKVEALKKLDKMLLEIAYPKLALNIEELDKYYASLDVRDTDSLSEIMEKITGWRIDDFFKQLRMVSDRIVSFNPADVDTVQYAPESNSLQIAVAILQTPFFHHTFPRALNYGGIGAVIGHEMTHGFDNKGSFYDAYGKDRKWWSEDSKEKYMQRAQCLVDQYGKIEIPGTGLEIDELPKNDLKIDGKSTLGENIADNGGVKLAYGHGGEEDRIKGLEQFDNNQMFFLGWATIWCEHSTISTLKLEIFMDVHSPNRYRVNQVLANQPEFAAAFNCDVGSAMNPTERCPLW